MVVGGTLGNVGSPLNLAAWAASAALIGGVLLAAYIVLLRHHIGIVPFAVALLTTAGTLREGWARAFPGALVGSLIGVVVMWLLAAAWFRSLDVLRRPAAGVAGGDIALTAHG